jgi:DNA-binding PadR family transcriptional regulator
MLFVSYAKPINTQYEQLSVAERIHRGHSPHWVGNDKKSQTWHRQYVILRELALHGPLTIYQIRKNMTKDDRFPLNLDYVTVWRNVNHLSDKKLISISRKSTARRQKRICQLTDRQVIGLLFFQHYLNSADIVSAINKYSFVAKAFVNLGLKKELNQALKDIAIQDVYKRFANEQKGALDNESIDKPTWNPQERIHYIASREITQNPETFGASTRHAYDTLWRDLIMELLLKLLAIVSEKPELFKKLKAELRKSVPYTLLTELTELVKDFIDGLIETREYIDKTIDQLNRINGLLKTNQMKANERAC